MIMTMKSVKQRQLIKSLVILVAVAIMFGVVGIEVFRYRLLSVSKLTGEMIDDGVFYFNIPHKGFYRFDPLTLDPPKRLLKRTEYSSRVVSNGTVFYINGKTIYSLQEGKKEKAASLKKYKGKAFELLYCERGEIAFSYLKDPSEKNLEFREIKIRLSDGVEIEDKEYMRPKREDFPFGVIEAITDRHIFYTTYNAETGNDNLFCYSKESGKTSLLMDDMRVFYTTTDDRWFYIYNPWEGHKISCWTLEYGDDGMPTELKLYIPNILDL